MYNRISGICIVTSFIARALHTQFQSQSVGCLDKEDNGMWQVVRGSSR